MTTLLLALALVQAGRDVTVAVPPVGEDKYASATYRAWIPEDVPVLRGVIVRQHGCGEGARRHGLSYPLDLQWRELARKHGCALLGSHLVDRDGVCPTWCVPFNGTEGAFLRALAVLADRSGHPELEHVPWALWGHSGGALWVTNMAYAHPDRTVAVFPKSGALMPERRREGLKSSRALDSSPGALRVPMLFCYGAREADPKNRFHGLVEAVRAMIRYGRPKGALWAFAPEPECEHNNRNTRALAIPFFDAMLARRLPPAGDAPTAPVRLPPDDGAGGWLGNPSTGEIAPAGAFAGDRATAAWLPGETFAKAWASFLRNGTVPDDTPPPAPTGVRIDRVREGAVVTWRATADLESGLSAFRVYRDGDRIAEVRGPKGAFVAWNYHDQPDPPDGPPPMRHVDANPPASARYEVSSVNRAGLESPRTAAR